MNLPPPYHQIWTLAAPHLAKGRWPDLWHTEIAVEHMQHILNGEQRNDLESILLPAIILHDIGWSQIGEEKNTDWGKRELRIEHMQKGAALAKTILETVNYETALQDKIVALIATHDNEYLGIKATTDEEKILRDADACFIFTELSFWKGYLVKGKGKTPRESLQKILEKFGKRYTKTAQEIVESEIEKREVEIKDASLSAEERFERLRLSALEKIEQVV